MDALSAAVGCLSSVRNIAGGHLWADGRTASASCFGCQGGRRANGSDLPAATENHPPSVAFQGDPRFPAPVRMSPLAIRWPGIFASPQGPANQQKTSRSSPPPVGRRSWLEFEKCKTLAVAERSRKCHLDFASLPLRHFYLDSRRG
jgi:hypothetical protein